jgi:hypothetical protein
VHIFIFGGTGTELDLHLLDRCSATGARLLASENPLMVTRHVDPEATSMTFCYCVTLSKVLWLAFFFWGEGQDLTMLARLALNPLAQPPE